MQKKKETEVVGKNGSVTAAPVYSVRKKPG